MATIRKRLTSDGKARYTAVIRHTGYKPVYLTRGIKKEAEKEARRIELAMENGTWLSPSRRAPDNVAAIIERFCQERKSRESKQVGKGLQTEMDRLNWWSQEIGLLGIGSITPKVLLEARAKLMLEQVPVVRGLQSKSAKRRAAANGIRTRPRSNSTINRYMSAISAVLTFAVEEALIEWNPARAIKQLTESKHRERFLSETERIALLSETKAAQNPMLHTIVVLALVTGAREGELRHLKPGDVDLEAKTLALYGPNRETGTKNRTVRHVPLVEPGLSLMREQMATVSPDQPWIFPGSDPEKPYDWTTVFRRAVKRAGIKDFCFHALRHTCASYLLQCGVPLQRVGKILGHKDIKTTTKYAHLIVDQQRDDLEMMSREYFKDPQNQT